MNVPGQGDVGKDAPGEGGKANEQGHEEVHDGQYGWMAAWWRVSGDESKGEGGGVEETRPKVVFLTAKELRLGRCWKVQVSAETKIPCGELGNQGKTGWVWIQERER